MAQNNLTIMSKVWLKGSTDFQHRIPNPTQSGLQATMDALFDPMNRNYYNEFVDSLINRIGRSIVRRQRWENKLRAFKQENLPYGSTVQEIASKWIQAHAYDMDEGELLLKLERPEAQVWYHSQNRQDKYKISVIDPELRRAFTSEYGLNEYIASIIDLPYNADAWDEYLIMKNLIPMYEHNWGFFKVHVDEITDESTAKNFLEKARAFAGKLEFPSTLYNAQSVMDIPVFANRDELVLITTPETQATLDVQALAALFNVDKADIQYKTVMLDSMPIPGAVALLTTKDWFVVHDTLYETQTFYNGETLANTYFLHHWGVYSCSPFVPAILFTTEDGTDVNTVTQTVTGLEASIYPERIINGQTAQIITKLIGTIEPEDSGLEVVPDAVTYELSAKRTTDDGTEGVQLNGATYVDRFGVLHTQKTLKPGDVITVECTSTYINPDGPTPSDLTASVDVTIVSALAPDPVDPDEPVDPENPDEPVDPENPDEPGDEGQE